MPARTPAKKTMPSKKPAAAKKPARSAKLAASKPKHSNGPQAKARTFAAQPAKGESDKLRQQLREKNDLLQRGQQRITGLERELEDARKSGHPTANLDPQLRDLQARFTTRQAELEAARAEAQNLREAVAKTRAPGEPGNLRCPRCGCPM